MSSSDDQSQVKKFVSEKDLTNFIESSLKNYQPEEIVWILDEFLYFRSRLEDVLKRSSSGELRRIKDCSDFTEIKQEFIRLVKTLKDWNHIYLFFDDIKKKATQHIFFKTFTEIKTNIRLCSFIYNVIKNNKDSTNIFEYNKNIYLLLIYSYYINQENSNRKNFKIENAISNFNNEIKSINKNLSKKFENKAFPSWAYSYLKSVDPDFDRIRYIPTDEINYQNLINAYLDYLAYSDKVFYENLMNKLNKAWSQKKFRDADKVKKNYHLPLTKNSKKKLKELADFYKKTEYQILENLIEEMYLKKMCDEKGKSIYESL